MVKIKLKNAVMHRINVRFYKEEYDQSIDVLQMCGNVLLEAQQNGIRAGDASSASFVKATQRAVEHLLVEKLRTSFHNYRFFGLMTVAGMSDSLTNEYTWIIDPIEGMHDYHCLTMVNISLALYYNKLPIMGFIYNPFTKTMYQAVKDHGAYLNDRRIKVSTCDSITECLLSIDVSTSMAELSLANKVRGFLTLGSCTVSMTMVALGRSDAHYVDGVYYRKIAAAGLIIEEAGGVCIDPLGGPVDALSQRVLCAATMELAQELVNDISQYYPPRHYNT